jgi:hypothetical protein
MTSEQFGTSHLSDELLRELGRLSVHFNLLELVLRFAISDFARIPKVAGLAVVRRHSFFQLTRTLIDVAESPALEDRREEILSLVKRARDASGSRNALLHSIWGGTEDGEVVRSSPRDLASTRCSVADVKLVTSKVTGLVQDIIESTAK